MSASRLPSQAAGARVSAAGWTLSALLLGLVAGACARPLASSGACAPGDTRACYRGAPETRDRGECAPGRETCGPDRRWGACAGEVLPTVERCNLRDDDCDGVIDDGFERAGAPCVRRRGRCRTEGAWRCPEDGGGAVCDAALPVPVPEVCNGRDDDCDGVIDNPPLVGLGAPCQTGLAGRAAHGVTVCAWGQAMCQPDGAARARPCAAAGVECELE